MQFPSNAVSILLIVVGLCGTVVGLRSHVFRGIGLATVAAMLIPTWDKVSLLGAEFDCRVLVAIGAAAVATVFRPRWLFDRLVWADFVVAFLWIWQAFSEWNATGDVVEPTLLSYGFWVLPYVVGRCSARTLADLNWLAWAVTAVCIVIGITTLVEFSAGIDLFQLIFGEKPSLKYHPDKLHRWGFVRSEGPFTHPIFLGTIAMLMLPWLVWQIIASSGKRRIMAAFGSAATVSAAITSISRGPMLGVLLSLVIAAVIRFRKLMWATVAVSFVVVLLLLAKPDYVDDLTLWFSRSSGERERMVAFDGDLQVYTSSMSRVLVIRHYWDSVRHAGMLGYGMTATDTFPPNVPYVPFEEVSRKQYPIIDNSYLLLALRGGWILCLAFLLLHAAAIYQFHTTIKRHPELVSFGRLMIGAICAHAFVVFTVYPDYDFMFVFLWTVGVSSVQLHDGEEEVPERA